MKVLSLKELCYLSLQDTPDIVTEGLCDDLREFLDECHTKGWCVFCGEFVGEKGLMDYLCHDRDCGYFVEYLGDPYWGKKVPRIHLDGRHCDHCAVLITPDSLEPWILPFVEPEIQQYPGPHNYHEVVVCSRFCPAFSNDIRDVPYMDYCEGCHELCFVPLERWDSQYDSLYRDKKYMFIEWNHTFLNTLHLGTPKPYISLCSDACERSFKEEVGIRECPRCNEDMCTGFPYETESYQRHLRVCPGPKK